MLTEIMDFPTKHAGFVKKRIWCKVHWLRAPPGLQLHGEWDVLPKDQVAQYEPYVQIVQEIQTESCERGLSIQLGKSKDVVDNWIKKHAL